MVKHLVIAVVLVGCKGGDKCDKAWDRMAPAMQKEAKDGKAPDRAAMVTECKEELSKHPEREAMLDCVIAIDGEVTIEKLMACSSAKGKDGKDGKDKGDSPKSAGRRTEAEIMLNKIGKLQKMTFAESAAFSKGKVGPSPAQPCCGGPQAKCAVDAKAWDDPIWKAMEFTIDEPHSFQYTFESDGKTFTAMAIGDLDCDTNMITYKLEGTVDQAGNPKVNLTPPTTED